MRAIAATLLAALSKDRPEPVWVVQIQASSTALYTFTSKDYGGVTIHGSANDELTGRGHYPSIIKVTPVGAEVDPTTREFSCGDLEVIVADDGPARSMIETHWLKGCPVTLFLGALGVNEGDWLRIGEFFFSDHAPAPKTITLKAVDPNGVLLDTRVEQGAWRWKHPLEIALSVEQSALPSSLYDGDSFDPLAYADTISHWCVRDDTISSVRGLDRLTDREVPTIAGWPVGSLSEIAGGRKVQKWGDPIQAKSLLAELGECMGASFLPSADPTFPLFMPGRIKARVYSSSASVVRGLTTDDFIEPPNCLGTMHNVVNRVTVSFGLSDQKITLQDTASAAAFAYPGETERFYDAELKCPWANGEAAVDTMTDSQTTLVCDDAGLQAFTGTRWDLGNWTPSLGAAAAPPQEAKYQLTSSRVAYFLIRIPNSDDVGEIVKATAFAADFSLNGSFGQTTLEQHVRGGTFTVVRAQFGTTARAHVASEKVYDITIPVAMAVRRLQRFAYGCPEYEARVLLRHVDLEVTDFVAITHTLPCWKGRSFITESSAWEITRVEADTSDSAGVKLKLLLASDSYMMPGNSLSYTVPAAKKTSMGDLSQNARERVYGRTHIIEGFEVTDSGAGLEISLSPGKSASTFSRFNTTEAITVPVAPSKDTYVYVDPVTRGVHTIAVANGASAPDTPEGCAHVGTVETNASAITALADERNFYALEGSTLDASTIDADTIPYSAMPGSTAKGMAVRFSRSKVIDAGAAGTADDVGVDLSLDCGVKVLGATIVVTTAIGGSTATLRDTSGGGGNALSSDFDTASTGRKESTLASFPSVAQGGTIYLRRSDRGIAGTVVLDLEKT